MREAKTKDICFICGTAHGAPEGGCCDVCGATPVESAIVHLLVKYSGGGEKSAVQSHDQLKFRRILAIDPPGGLDEAMTDCPLYRGVSAGEALSVRQAADGLPFDVILLFTQVDLAMAERLNGLLGDGGVVIARPGEILGQAFGNVMDWDVEGTAVSVYHRRLPQAGDFTGERFMPGIEDAKLEIEHMQRYLSVRGLVKGLDVLDLACGEGYGSAFLAETAAHVLGVDIDGETVDRAAVKYRRENLRYQQGDAANIPLGDHSVDAVVSFETIEHIDEALQRQFLKEIDRVLKDDGILIMSTPNKEVYSDRYNYFNEFHIHEFYHDEFLEFLRTYFPCVKLYQQSFQVVSLLSGCGDTPQTACWYGNAVGTEDAKYYIAVAARRETRLSDVASVYVQGTGEYEEKTQRIVDLQNEETLRNLHIENLDREMREEKARRDAHIRELDEELTEKGGLIRDLQTEQAQRDAHIEKLDREMREEKARRDAHIRELDEELTEKGGLIRDLQAEQAQRDAHIRELDEELTEKGGLIRDLQAEQAQRDAHIRELDEELTEKGGLIRDLQAEEARRNAHIQKLDGEIEEKNSYIQSLQGEKRDLEAECAGIAADRDQFERQRNELVEERDALKGYLKDSTAECESLKKTVEEKDIELNNKQGHINLLLESDRELQNIKRSGSYRLFSKWWKLRDAMAPTGTRRRLVLKLGAKFLRHPIRCLKKVNPNRVRQFARGMKSGEIATTAARLDTCLGGSEASAERPEQLPLVEFESIGAVPSLHVPCASHPAVSIVIPVYNQFAYTYACLKSIAKNSGDVPFEVIIADDCSTDLTKHIGKAITGIRVARTRKNLRFLLNCNNAAKQARGRYILFLNNDTQVMPGWLAPLVELIERDEGIGMVGSKLIYPDGRLQEAGGILWQDGSAWNYGHLQDPAMPEYNYVKEVDYISGAAIMIRADLWKKLGGFDERFAPAYCEDSDLAFEVRKAGYKVLFQPKSVVIHYEGVSNGTDTSSGLKAYQVENSKKFYEKWKDTLEREHNPNGVNPFLARDRSLHRKTLLFVDHYVPQYDKDAGSRTVFAYIRMFARSGFNVKFIGDNFYPHQPYTSDLQQMGVEVLYGNWYGQHWKEWLVANKDSFDFVFLNRPHIAVNYIDLIRRETHAHILYYGHDLHFMRARREYEVTGNEALLKEAEEWKERELSLMRKADLAAYPSQVEIDEIKKIDPSINAVAITPYFYDEMPDVDYDFAGRKDLFFIGGYTHGPNVDAVKWIASDIMPGLRKKLPGVKIHIAGSNMPQELINLGSEDILMEGQLTDEQLKTFYGKSRLNLIPLRYGAGIKGKVVESMLYGLPVVTTSCGAEGIVDADGVLMTADTAKALVDRIAAVYNDEKTLKHASRAGIQYIRTHYTEKRAKQILNDVYHFDGAD